MQHCRPLRTSTNTHLPLVKESILQLCMEGAPGLVIKLNAPSEGVPFVLELPV